MDNKKKYPGVEVRKNSIRIVFMYNTARCRETLKGLEVNNANLKFAANKRASILHEIAIGNFDYLAHFPGFKTRTAADWKQGSYAHGRTSCRTLAVSKKISYSKKYIQQLQL